MEFSHPVLASSVQREDIVVRLNNGDAITPMNIGVIPNSEYNERSTLLMNGDFGNRLDPADAGAVYPVQFEIVGELMLVTPNGLFNAIGLTYGDGSEPLTAYIRAGRVISRTRKRLTRNRDPNTISLLLSHWIIQCSSLMTMMTSSRLLNSAR